MTTPEQNELLTRTRGLGIMHHSFHGYVPKSEAVLVRQNGVMIAKEQGDTTAYALENLQDRGVLFVGPGDQVYEGQVVGEHCRDNDLGVNVCREKKLTNMRAAGSDKNILLKPPRLLTLEIALEYIESDELVEITPSKIRLRKKVLTEEGRKRAERGGGKKVGV